MSVVGGVSLGVLDTYALSSGISSSFGGNTGPTGARSSGRSTVQPSPVSQCSHKDTQLYLPCFSTHKSWTASNWDSSTLRVGEGVLLRLGRSSDSDVDDGEGDLFLFLDDRYFFLLDDFLCLCFFRRRRRFSSSLLLSSVLLSLSVSVSVSLDLLFFFFPTSGVSGRRGFSGEAAQIVAVLCSLTRCRL